MVLENTARVATLPRSVWTAKVNGAAELLVLVSTKRLMQLGAVWNSGIWRMVPVMVQGWVVPRVKALVRVLRGC